MTDGDILNLEMPSTEVLTANSSSLNSISKQVLLVDDNENLLSSVKRHLRKIVDLDTANSGVVALELMKTKEYAVIVSDMQMPQMDGIELLSRVKDLSPKTIRVMLTGNANLDVAIDGINKGDLFRFLTKPSSKEDLSQTMLDGIFQYRLREENRLLSELNTNQNKVLRDINLHLEEKVNQRTQALKETNELLKQQNIEVIMTFSKLIEVRAGIVKGHAKYIAQKASELAKKMGLNDTEVQDTLIAGLLLQIGKTTLTEKTLNKPFNLLNKIQRDEYLNHAKEGERLLLGMKHLKMPAKYIRHQYERFGGLGTPDKLEAENIPLASRILAVVQNYIDNVNGVITGSKCLGSEARDILIKNKHRVYDPAVVDEFVLMLGNTQTSYKNSKVEWFDLYPGMLLDEVFYKGSLYCKNIIVTPELIDDLTKLRTEHGDQLEIKVKVR